MHIERDAVVSLNYELYTSDGNLIEKTEAPIDYLHGGYDGIFERVEQALQGKSSGDACDVYLEPADAFGDYDSELVMIEARDKFPPDLEVGMRFQGMPEASDEARVYTVTDIADDKVVVDGNHPLAGMALHFKGTVTGVRKASAEEIEHGHVHGAHGHHH